MDSSPSDSQVTLIIPSTKEEKRKGWNKKQKAAAAAVAALLVVVYIIKVWSPIFEEADDTPSTGIRVLRLGHEIPTINETMTTANGQNIYLKLSMRATAQLYHPGKPFDLTAFKATVFNAEKEAGNSGVLTVSPRDLNSASPSLTVISEGSVTFVKFAITVYIHRDDPGFDICMSTKDSFPLKFTYNFALASGDAFVVSEFCSIHCTSSNFKQNKWTRDDYFPQLTQIHGENNALFRSMMADPVVTALSRG